jgi:hypothetical protein
MEEVRPHNHPGPLTLATLTSSILSPLYPATTQVRGIFFARFIHYPA